MPSELDRPESLMGRIVMCGPLDAFEYLDQPVPRYSVLVDHGQVLQTEEWIEAFEHFPPGAHVDISVGPSLDEAEEQHEVRPLE